jgi:putative hydrolase of the HAD superfamily
MIQHVFFDLDHTLWDFERNSEECLKYIYQEHLSDKVLYADFITHFRIINKSLWRDLEFDRITHEELRKTRFSKTFHALQLDCTEEKSLKMNETFMEHLPHQKHLMDGTLEILEYLKPKYDLHIISNGYLDIQTKKMRHSGILNYFSAIVTSDVAQSRKPNRKIFDIALELAGTTRQNSVYIGDDDVADKIGAENAEMPFIYYNIHSTTNTSQEISELSYLKNIL